MKKILAILTLAMVLFAIVPMVAANSICGQEENSPTVIKVNKTIIFCDSTGLRFVPWSGNLQVPKFNMSLGKLLKVTINGSALIDINATFENVDPFTGANFTINYTGGNVIVNFPDMNLTILVNGFILNGTVGPYDNVTDFSGISGRNFNLINVTNININANNLNLYESNTSQNLIIPTSSSGSAVISGLANFDGGVRTMSSANVCISYTYEVEGAVSATKCNKCNTKTVTRYDTCLVSKQIRSANTMDGSQPKFRCNQCVQDCPTCPCKTDFYKVGDILNKHVNLLPSSSWCPPCGCFFDAEADISVYNYKGLDNTRITLRVNHLYPAGGVFTAWLVDTSVTPNDKLNLGSFTTNYMGRGTLVYRQNLPDFNKYDTLRITNSSGALVSEKNLKAVNCMRMPVNITVQR